MAKAQFDRDDVLDRSMDLFWRHGFSASSMQQVVETTGLKPGSIYLAFGSKEGLFREALERYAGQSIERIGSTLDTAPSVGEGICALFEKNIEESTRKNYSSCFLVKTQLELAAEGSELYKIASARLSEIEALFRGYLEREFSKTVSRRRAASIMLHLFGMRVYGYHEGSAERMRQGLREGLPWLPWPRQS